MCYSGQCYLSEHLAGRSANRGACVQACRSLYDLEDADGRVLVRNKALLSLKDFNLIHRLEDLAEAGADSFKIEGRLKSVSYVRNVVRAYSDALDALVRRFPDKYRRASFGTLRGGFKPDLKKTFNRDYTELFLDGKRGEWAAMDAPKSMGEYIGTVDRLRAGAVTVRPENPGITLHNGDGFAFVGRDGGIVGFRGDVCEGSTIRCKEVPGLKAGMRLYRNIDAEFERRLEADRPVREIGVRLQARLSAGALAVTAVSEDGRKASVEIPAPFDVARDADRMLLCLQRIRSGGGRPDSLHERLLPEWHPAGPCRGPGRAAGADAAAPPRRRAPRSRAGSIDLSRQHRQFRCPGNLPGAGERRHRGCLRTHPPGRR